jgi:RNA recognition motif-containing protein
LKKLCSSFGEVNDAEIIYNDRGSKGFGFVTFLKASEADEALKQLNGQKVDGRQIGVNVAHPKVWDKKGENMVRKRSAPSSTLRISLCSSSAPLNILNIWGK